MIQDVRLSPAEAAMLVVGRYAAKRLPAAESLCRSWLSVRPEASDALHLLGLICLESGRSEEATAHFEAARAVNPADADIWFALADLLRAEQRNLEAALAYERALALRPDWASALSNLAAVREALGAPGEAP